MSETVKVLLTANSSWNIINFRSLLLASLKERGYQVVVVAPRDEHTEALIQRVDHYVDLPMESSSTSPLKDFKLFRRYQKCLRELKPDVICAYTIKPNIYGTLAAARLRIPVINNVSGLGTAFIRNNWLTFVVKKLYRLAFSCSSKVFFQNPSDKALFIENRLLPADKASLLPGSGVDLQHFSPVENSDIGADKPVSFILIARMLWDKGVKEFVDAAKQVKQQEPHVAFYLLGPTDIDNKTAIARTVIDEWHKEGIVQYLGETKDTRPYMAKNSCVVLPSYREGMSRVLLEGAAMAKPLIASNVPGCADVVRDGVNGFLCDVKESDSLAMAMLKYIHLPEQEKRQMGQTSRKIAEDRFDEKIVVQRYIDAIEESIGG